MLPEIPEEHKGVYLISFSFLLHQTLFWSYNAFLIYIDLTGVPSILTKRKLQVRHKSSFPKKMSKN
jgi:hypothetical protein